MKKLFLSTMLLLSIPCVRAMEGEAFAEPAMGRGQAEAQAEQGPIERPL